MIQRLILPPLLFCLFGLSALQAQETASPDGDECEISIAEMPKCSKDESRYDCGKRIKILREVKFRTLIGEEDRTLKAVAIPRTNLYATGEVFYTDEAGLGSINGADSMRLALVISRFNGARAWGRAWKGNTAQYLSSEFTLNGFDISQVRTLVWHGKHLISIILKCQNHSLKEEQKRK